MADYVTFDGVDFAAQSAATAAAFTLPPAYVDACARLAASRLRRWVDRSGGMRPTRDELRVDVEPLLDERLRLHRDLEIAREARDSARAAVERAAEQITKLRTERDEWHAVAREHAAQVVKVREARDSARTLRDQHHEAYHQAEAERNTLARENAKLRSELAAAKESAALRGEALILHLAVPGGGR